VDRAPSLRVDPFLARRANEPRSPRVRHFAGEEPLEGPLRSNAVRPSPRTINALACGHLVGLTALGRRASAYWSSLAFRGGGRARNLSGSRVMLLGYAWISVSAVSRSGRTPGQTLGFSSVRSSPTTRRTREGHVTRRASARIVAGERTECLGEDKESRRRLTEDLLRECDLHALASGSWRRFLPQTYSLSLPSPPSKSGRRTQLVRVPGAFLLGSWRRVRSRLPHRVCKRSGVHGSSIGREAQPFPSYAAGPRRFGLARGLPFDLGGGVKGLSFLPRLRAGTSNIIEEGPDRRQEAHPGSGRPPRWFPPATPRVDSLASSDNGGSARRRDLYLVI